MYTGIHKTENKYFKSLIQGTEGSLIVEYMLSIYKVLGSNPKIPWCVCVCNLHAFLNKKSILQLFSKKRFFCKWLDIVEGGLPLFSLSPSFLSVEAISYARFSTPMSREFPA